MKSRYRGFTIVELLIVISVIGVLAAVSIVAYSGIGSMANDAAVKSELGMMYRSLLAYEATHGSENAFDSGGDYFELSNEGDMGAFNGTPFTEDGEAVMKEMLGISPSSRSYYQNSEEAAILLKWDYIWYKDSDTGAWRWRYGPVLYARSASGRVFKHDGSGATQDYGQDNEEIVESLKNEINNLLAEIEEIDRCYAGTGDPEWCGDMSDWPPIEEWRQWRGEEMERVEEMRQELHSIENNGFSLSSVFQSCGSSFIFHPTTGRWYLVANSC